MYKIREAINLGLAAGMLAGALALSGCDSMRSDNSLAEPMSVALTPATKSVVVGDSVTIASQTRNMMASDATLQWTSTGGDLSPMDNGRAARVRFDKPGTYTVTVKAVVNGVVVDSDAVDIHVRDLMPNRTRESDINRDNDNDNRTDNDSTVNPPRDRTDRDNDTMNNPGA